MKFPGRFPLIAEKETGEVMGRYYIDAVRLQCREITKSSSSKELEILRGSRVSCWAGRVGKKDVKDCCKWVFFSELPGPVGFRFYSSVSLIESKCERIVHI